MARLVAFTLKKIFDGGGQCRREYDGRPDRPILCLRDGNGDGDGKKPLASNINTTVYLEARLRIPSI